MQQSKAKVEKARMQMEEEKRARAKAERELQRALEEQERLQTLLANAANAGVSDEEEKRAQNWCRPTEIAVSKQHLHQI